MFLPFLPFLIALGILSSFAVMGPSEETLLGAWETALIFLAVPVLGWLVGNLNNARLENRSPMRLSLRRVLALGIWGGVLATGTLHGSLNHYFSDLSPVLVFAVLLLQYWITDTLVLTAYQPWKVGTLSEQGIHFLRTMAISLPIGVLVLGSMALSPLQSFLESTTPLPPSAISLGFLGLYILVSSLAVPDLIRLSWGLKPLPHKETNDIILEEINASGVRLKGVLSWPASLTGSTTAGVIGIFPRFRYLLFSEIFTQTLTADEIRSITAHEAGHLKYKHLWYYLISLVAFALLIQSIMEVLLLGGVIYNQQMPLGVSLALEVGGLLLFLRYGLGFLSRVFERQADTHALERHGLVAFTSAIYKVAGMNHIPVEANNWHHYGIAQRIEYLSSLQSKSSTEPGKDDPHIVAHNALHVALHNALVKKVKVFCLGALVLTLTAQVVLSSQSVVTFVAEGLWGDKLNQVTQPTPRDIQAAEILAQKAFQANDYPTAERFFRLMLSWKPTDPRTQNNLAWVLVTQGAREDQIQEGLTLAKKAAQADHSAFIWDTLAEAHHKANNGEEAQKAALYALKLAKDKKGKGNAPLSYYQKRLAALKNPLNLTQ